MVGRRGWIWAWALGAGVGAGATLAWLLRSGRERLPGPDLVALQSMALELSLDAQVEVRDLGDGIVELVGEVTSPELARLLVDTLAAVPGVEAVLDRLWVTPPPVGIVAPASV